MNVHLHIDSLFLEGVHRSDAPRVRTVRFGHARRVVARAVRPVQTRDREGAIRAGDAALR